MTTESAPRVIADRPATHACYNHHSPHRARKLRPPRAAEVSPAAITDLTTGKIRRREVLGGLINEYKRAA